jgi:hypothetical protein
MTLQTEFEFTLPHGYPDGEGNLHKQGTMRLATAMDEIAPLRDLRVKSNQALIRGSLRRCSRPTLPISKTFIVG